MAWEKPWIILLICSEGLAWTTFLVLLRKNLLQDICILSLEKDTASEYYHSWRCWIMDNFFSLPSHRRQMMTRFWGPIVIPIWVVSLTKEDKLSSIPCLTQKVQREDENKRNGVLLGGNPFPDGPNHLLFSERCDCRQVLCTEPDHVVGPDPQAKWWILGDSTNQTPYGSSKRIYKDPTFSQVCGPK